MIDQDLIIGAPIVRHENRLHETDSHLIYTSPTKNFPIRLHKNDKLLLYLQSPITLNPKETISTLAYTANEPTPGTDISITIYYPHYEITHKTAGSVYNIKLRNNTNRRVLFSIDTPVGHIDKLADQKTTNSYIQTSYGVFLLKTIGFEESISQSDTLSASEKKHEIDTFRKTGIGQLPLTDVTDSSKRECEFSTDNGPRQTLDQIDLSHLDPDTRQKILPILKANEACFAKTEYHTGCVPKETLLARLPLKDDANLDCAQKYYPVNPSIKQQVQTILDRYREQGIIEVCNQPARIISNLLIIRKKDKNLRVLCDLRLANQNARHLSTPTLSMAHICDALANNPYRSGFDLSNSFFQIMVHPDDRTNLCFYDTNKVLHCWTRLPQGAKQSSYWLAQLCSKITFNIDYVISYADDLIISAPSLSAHNHTLNALLTRLTELNITIKPSKLSILPSEITFIGYTIKDNCISIPDTKVLAFQNIKAPSTARQAKGLLMAFSFYRRWIANFSKITENIRLSTLPNTKFEWTNAAQTELDNLKTVVKQDLKLHMIDYDKEIICCSDGSKTAVAFAVGQIIDGILKPICFVSRTLSTSERNYGATKIEALSCIYGLITLEPYLRYANKGITLYTDCRPLIFLSQARHINSHLARLSMILTSYDIKVVHIEGKNNHFADFLSRIGLERDPEPNNTKLYDEKTTEWLISKLKLRDGYTLTEDDITRLFSSDPLKPPQTIGKSRKRPKIKEQTTTVFKPDLLLPKKIHMPPSRKLTKTEKRTHNPNDLTSGGASNRSKHVTFQNNAHETVKSNPYRNDRPPTPYTTQPAIINYYNQQPHFHPTLDETDAQIFALHQIQEENDRPMNDIIQPLADINTQTQFIKEGLITHEILIEAQRHDEFCNNILANLNTSNDYFIERNILKKRRPNKPVLPESLLHHLVRLLHYSLVGAHTNHTKITQIIGETYFMQDLATKVKNLTKVCFFCSYYKTIPRRKLIINGNLRALRPRHIISIDLFGNFPTTQTYRFKLCCLFVDHFSGYCTGYPIRGKNENELLRVIKLYVQHFSSPTIFKSDEEPALLSDKIQSYFTDNNIQHITTSPYSPNSNSVAERKVGIIKNLLRTNLMAFTTKQTEWPSVLPAVIEAINKTPTIYGASPETILFGNTSLCLLEPSDHPTTEDEYKTYIQNTIAKLRKDTFDRRLRLIEKTNEHTNKTKEARTFKVNDIVDVEDVAIHKFQSLQAKRTGPYKIVSLTSNNNSARLVHLITNKPRLSHIKYLHHTTDFTNMPI